jgi:radical SAM protein with 4Fe4S-binding SPASM domain
MEFKGKNKKHCWRLWHDPVITWDGAVVPCCFDKDAQHKLGDLKSQSFKEIWQHAVYNTFVPGCCKAVKTLTSAPTAPKV